MSQPEGTRRKLALGATVVIVLFIFIFWLGNTTRTVSVSVKEAGKVAESVSPNSPIVVIKNLGEALTGLFSKKNEISAEVDKLKGVIGTVGSALSTSTVEANSELGTTTTATSSTETNNQ